MELLYHSFELKGVECLIIQIYFSYEINDVIFLRVGSLSFLGFRRYLK